MSENQGTKKRGITVYITVFIWDFGNWEKLQMEKYNLQKLENLFPKSKIITIFAEKFFFANCTFPYSKVMIL